MTTGLEEIDEVLDPTVDVPPEVEPELVDFLPRGYLSPSQVTAFLKCAHSWELSYVQRKPRRGSARMFQGVFVHAGVEAVLKERLLSGKLPPLELATDTFGDVFEAKKQHIEDWEGETEGFVKDVGIRCTKAYYDEAAASATPVVVEKTVTAIIRSADGKVRLPVLGRLDSEQVQSHTEQEYQDIRERLVAGGSLSDIKKPLRIHDLKVVTDKWSASDLDNDLQFVTYAGIEHIPDVQVDMVVKGRAKNPRPRYVQLAGVVTHRQVEHVQDVMEGVARSIALGHFPKTDPGNWWCSETWCSMWVHCRGK